MVRRLDYFIGLDLDCIFVFCELTSPAGETAGLGVTVYPSVGRIFSSRKARVLIGGLDAPVIFVVDAAKKNYMT